MYPVYHVKITVSTKNFTRSEARKCGVKGLVQWRGFDGVVEILVSDNASSSLPCSGAFGENSPRVDPQFYSCPATMGNDWESSRHGYTHKGTVERGIERELYFTASHRISIYFSHILRPPLEGRALHSQECFFPPRGGFNLRCTQFTTQR